MLPAVGEEDRDVGAGGLAGARTLLGRATWPVAVLFVGCIVVISVAAFLYGRSQSEVSAAGAAPRLDRVSTTTGDSTTSVPPTSTSAVTSTTTPPPTAAPATSAPPVAPAAPPVAAVPAATPDDRYSFPISPSGGASYARSHHDYPAADIFAPCGTDVVAPKAGLVQDVSYDNTWTSATDSPESRGGLSFSIVGDDGVRYYGSHLRELDAAVVPGNRVGTGQRLGAVGDTGNARGTGCHLHFGISTPCGPGDVLRRRGEFWPQEFLDAWRDDEWTSPSPLTDVPAC